MSGEVNVIPTLRKFRGGPVEAFWGGGQLKRIPCIYFYNVESEHLFTKLALLVKLLLARNSFKPGHVLQLPQIISINQKKNILQLSSATSMDLLTLLSRWYLKRDKMLHVLETILRSIQLAFKHRAQGHGSAGLKGSCERRKAVQELLQQLAA